MPGSKGLHVGSWFCRQRKEMLSWILEFHVPMGENNVEHSDLRSRERAGVIPLKCWGSLKVIEKTKWSCKCDRLFLGKSTKKIDLSDSFTCFMEEIGNPSNIQHINLKIYIRWFRRKQRSLEEALISSWNDFPLGEVFRAVFQLLGTGKRLFSKRPHTNLGFRNNYGKQYKRQLPYSKHQSQFYLLFATLWQRAFLQEIMADRIY